MCDGHDMNGPAFGLMAIDDAVIANDDFPVWKAREFGETASKMWKIFKFFNGFI